MSIVRVGSNQKFTNGWDAAFGGKKSSRGAAVAKGPATKEKSAKKAKAKPARSPKKAAKKKKKK